MSKNLTAPAERSGLIDRSPDGDPTKLSGLSRQTSTGQLTEETFRLVVEGVPTAVIAVDRAGKISFVNASAEKLFGYRPEELIGQPIEILIPERFRGNHPGHREAFYSAPELRQMGTGRDLFGLRKDGTEFAIEIGLNPIQTGQGLLVVTAIVDISQRKCEENELVQTYRELESRIEERTSELQHANRQLSTLNEDLDAFVYVASHDLQEPVRNLVAFAALLRGDLGEELPEQAARDLVFITDAANRMRQLAADLLRLSRAGRCELNQQRVPLTDCVANALAALRTRTDEVNARVEKDTLPVVAGDATLLTQLYQNLIENALKYTAAESPLVRLTAEKDGPLWTLGVLDNGIGVEPKFAELIFEPFRRLHGMAEFQGSGIGLSVCRKSVERMGGKIWVESELGNGSHFKFTLPPADLEPLGA